MNKLQNARIEYYRALQEISDSVEHIHFAGEDIADNFMTAIDEAVEEEKKLRTKTLQLDGRRKYLLHLNEGSRDDSRLCVICRDEYDNAAMTPCGHFFCLPCLSHWINLHRKCPTCNAKVTPPSITRVSFNSIKRKTTGEAALISALRRTSGFSDVVTSKQSLQITSTSLKGSYGSKFDTIIRHILSLPSNEKVVLFSQWEQVLDILVDGLKANGIQCVRFSGPQRNQAAILFRRNPDVRVFVLNARSQSAGLTLVNATHVMIVEPILHPGVELQAINRVHRIGQTRTTHVWRYVALNTIEEGLFELYEVRRQAVAGKLRDPDSQPNDNQGEESADVENARMLPLVAGKRGQTAAGGELVGVNDVVALLKAAVVPRAEEQNGNGNGSGFGEEMEGVEVVELRGEPNRSSSSG